MTQRPAEAAHGRDTPEALAKAVREFNSWRFYDCHETLEDVWREAGGKSSAIRQAQNDRDVADFYQGLIKIAAGFHHILRDNHKGAVLLLADSLRLLAPYRPHALEVDVESLIEEVRRCLGQIEALGPERLVEFDRGTIPTIHLEGPASD